MDVTWAFVALSWLCVFLGGVAAEKDNEGLAVIIYGASICFVGMALVSEGIIQ